MKNITIRVDDEAAQWARVYAAKHGTSVSQMLGDMLRERMMRERGYAAAYGRWKGRQARTLKAQGARYPRRDDIHDR